MRLTRLANARRRAAGFGADDLFQRDVRSLVPDLGLDVQRAAAERSLRLHSVHRPWRYHSASYFVSYVGQFILRGRRLAMPGLFDRLQLAVYVPDAVFASFERAPESPRLGSPYVREGDVVNVYVGFHGTQERGSVLHSPQHCLPANGWYIASRERVTLPELGPDRPVNRLEVALGPNRQLVYYWYQGRGRILAGEYQSALYRAWDSATQNRTDEALVRFIVPYKDEQSESRLREFIGEFVPLLPAYLPG